MALDLATITAALEAQLKAALPSTYLVKRAEYINEDPQKTPWVGVYRGAQRLDTATLGRGAKNWKVQLDLRVIVQAASLKTGSQAEDRLQGYEQAVLAAIDADRTLGGTVQMIVGYSVEYDYKRDERGSIYFQAAIITITANAKTGG